MINILSILAIMMTLILGIIGILSEIKTITIHGKLLAILFISYVYIISTDCWRNYGMMPKMSTDDYYKYRSAIQTANAEKDKEALRQIQKQLIAKYGMDNEDVRQLLKQFRLSV